MWRLWSSALLVSRVVTARDCPQVQSCSKEALKQDSCCVPTPTGLFVFRQRFEPDVGGDMGSWGIDGLEVLDCTGKAGGDEPYSPTYTHEEIGSFVHRSGVMGGEEAVNRAEGEWAQSEVGEGVEELWERAWNTAGRYVSTLAPTCGGSKEDQVASFFHTLHQLQSRLPVGTILADFDIIPSEDVTYVLAELVEALSFQGHQPIVRCDNMTLHSISWSLLVTGTFQSAEFHPTKLDRTSNCPKDGIIYLPSTSSLSATTTTSYTWDEIYRPTPRAITKSHDEGRMVYRDNENDNGPEGQHEPETTQLKFFKGSDESREGKKEEKVEKQYWRDEL